MSAQVTNLATKLEYTDQTFLTDVVEGLRNSPQKTLPCKYFYDATGSKLYDQICELEEYYPTRTEINILETYVKEIVSALGANPYLIEYGSGSSVKTRTLLDNLPEASAYTPIDISATHLKEVVSDLEDKYPLIPIHPIGADYTEAFNLPVETRSLENKVVFYPGSSIGNFTPEEAMELLGDISRIVGTGGKLLIGIDLVKPIPVLEAAYNDAKHVTADFNLNLLDRINNELGGDFNREKFQHKAVFNHDKQRIEMHLISLDRQTVTIGGEQFNLDRAESIHTENSHKYTLSQFKELAQRAGWSMTNTWTDNQSWFALQLFEFTGA